MKKWEKRIRRKAKRLARMKLDVRIDVSAEVVNLQEGDIVVLRTDHMLTAEQVNVLRERWDEKFPGSGFKTVILTAGLRADIIRPVPAGIQVHEARAAADA